MTGFARPWSLPDDSKIAVVVEVAFEAFETHSTFITMPAAGTNLFSISYADYGWKAGIWRLLDVLSAVDVKATLAVNGLVAERGAEALRVAASRGMEICAHGWVNDHLVSGEAEERDTIQRCTGVLEAITGQRPVGWVSPGLMRTAMTLRLLAEEGYIWNGDDASDDRPFVVDTGAGDIAVVPAQGFAYNDLAAWSLARSSPANVWENFKDTFDVLYREGGEGSPKVMDVTLHAHVAGRPTLQPTVERMLAYAQDHDGVWFATKGELGKWALDHPPGAVPAAPPADAA